MSNPLFNTMSGNSMGMLTQRINQLKQMYSGNPMDHVQKMLNSGQISQAQYDRAVKQAQEIMKAMQK
jgi:vancomycin permeability regulator SanA